MSTDATQCWQVRGRVQGVHFRASCRQQALRLGLRGYAINLADGSVEVLACGPPAALLMLRGWLARGPVLARVDAVIALELGTGSCPDQGFQVG